MTRTTWKTIRDAIARDIDDGVLRPGAQLPTEPHLAARFAVGRHSIRRAIEALARDGKVSVEQGRGTFVEAAPRLTYHIGKRTRLRRNLIPQGCTVSGSLLSADRVPAPPLVSAALHLNPGSLVIESQRITLADELPVAFGAAYHCAERFPDFAARRDVLGSTTEAYRSYGIADYMRLRTDMHARPATAVEAKTLKQHADVPVIEVHAVDATPDGTPLSYSHVIWAAGRVAFTMGSEDG
ncbi:MAG: phosphonate metabolism transcriptional regulator PhnF [Pseudomonadota bacterium]